jgi:hypothetical protein
MVGYAVCLIVLGLLGWLMGHRECLTPGQRIPVGFHPGLLLVTQGWLVILALMAANPPATSMPRGMVLLLGLIPMLAVALLVTLASKGGRQVQVERRLVDPEADLQE